MACSIPPLAISSTRIRRLLAAGRSIRGLVPDAVADSLSVADIDALSRDNAATVLAQFGLGDARVPLFLPGSLAPTQVRISPNVTAEDKATVESVTKLLNFLLRGSRGGDESGAKDGQASIGADPARAIRELGPLLPAVATEVLPELVRRLNSRIAARTIREVFAEEGVAPAPAASR